MVDRNKSFLKDTVGVLLTKVVVIVLKLGVGVLTARLLGPAGRGLFYSVTQAGGVVSSLGTLSTGESIIYFLGKGRIERRHLAGLVVLSVTVFTLLVWGVLLALKPVLVATEKFAVLSDYWGFVLLFAPLMLAEYFCSLSLRATKDFALGNRLSILTRNIILVALAVGLFGIEKRPDIALYAYIMAFWVNSLIYLWVVLRISGWRLCLPEFGRVREMVRYGVHVHFGVMLTEMEYRADVFILLYFLSPTEVGIYSIGVAVAQILWFVSNAINTVLFPYLSHGADEDRAQFTSTVTKYTFYTNVIAGLGLAVVGLPLVLILYGAEYTESYYLFLAIIPGLMADSIARSLSTWLKGGGRPIVLSKVSMSTLILNIGLNIILIPQIGLYGAAMASVISYAVRALILTGLFCRISGIPAFRLFAFSRGELERVASVLKNSILQLAEEVRPRNGRFFGSP